MIHDKHVQISVYNGFGLIGQSMNRTGVWFVTNYSIVVEKQNLSQFAGDESSLEFDQNVVRIEMFGRDQSGGEN